MSNTILLGGLAFVMDAPFAPAQQSAPSPIKPIETDALEHGVYYIGRFRGETAIARGILPAFADFAEGQPAHQRLCV